MYCKYCGGKNESDAVFCGHCGRALKNQSGTQAAKSPVNKDPEDVQPVKVIVEQPVPTAKTNGYGIAGFVVGLLSLIWVTMIWYVALLIGPFSLIGPLIGDILSATGMKKAKDGSYTRANGLAVAGEVLSTIAAVIALIYTIIFFVALFGE